MLLTVLYINVNGLRRFGIGTIPELHLRKVGMLTLSGKLNIPTLRSSFFGIFRAPPKNLDKVRVYYCPCVKCEFGGKVRSFRLKFDQYITKAVFFFFFKDDGYDVGSVLVFIFFFLAL